MQRTYLDWAASAPVSRRAERAYIEALHSYGNPSSPHTEGRVAKDLLEDARVRIARLASVKAEAVIATSGATESNALAILGHINACMRHGAKPESLHVLYLPSAHASTRGAMEQLAGMGVRVEPLALAKGGIDPQALRKQLTPQTALVAVEAVCGETGTVFAVRDVKRVIASVEGCRAHLHVDASQLPRIASIELTRLGADTLSLDAQKVGGVRGTGVLIAPRHAQLDPLIIAGGQERNLRPGTQSHAGLAAFATALEEVDREREAFLMRAASMRSGFLKDLVIENLMINEGREQAPHILNLSLLDRDTDYVQALLDEAGFAVATRSACATDAEGSEAVLALTGDSARAAATLRISWGPATAQKDLIRFRKALSEAVRFVDRTAV